jgi:spore germination protein YaaH
MTLVKKFIFQLLIIALGFLIIFNSFPVFSFAASNSNLEVSGWIPYWRDSEGMKDAKKNIKDIDVVYPFAFVVKNDGTLSDLAGLTQSDWKSFIKYAQRKDVEVIPTIMWSSGTSIHAVLSDDDLRENHIDEIVDMVKKGKYDGVDIDYESKLADTIDYYSLFLKELKKALGKKILTCTIEARTPPESLYKTVPAKIEYANDYKAIAKYCDRVEIMAYDQQRADLKLNEEKAGSPYMPLADIDWVEKVVQLALEDIPAEKILLGIPTYGHHYTVTVSPNWYQGYTKIGALNVPDILDVAKEYKVTPGRNKAGEMSYTYFPKSSVYKALSVLPVTEGTQKGNEAAAQALLYANLTGQTVNFNIAWYSDAEAIEQKVDLAKKYDLRGIALFKIDGEEDKDIWKFID